jgi:hypothetical protein
MEPSDLLPSHTKDVQRGSPRDYSTRRVDIVQRLVDRMPINPKIAVFESTQESLRFLSDPIRGPLMQWLVVLGRLSKCHLVP